MKSILKSVGIISAVVALAVTATGAYFSDTETSTGNTFTAGRLDLEVNGENPLDGPVVTLTDLKPSYTHYTDPITLRVIDNPGKLYKHIVNDAPPIICTTGSITEPECDAEGGNWDEGQQSCTGSTDENNDLHKVTWFDLEVWVGPGQLDPDAPQCDLNANPAVDQNCWNVIIPDVSVTLDQIASHWIYLGTFGEPEQPNEITIRQSFHMNENAGNEYQGDTCTFSEEFMVQQTNASHPANCVDPAGNEDPNECQPLFGGLL